MKPRFDGAAALTALFALWVAIVLYQTLGLGAVARSVPLVVCIPTLALILFQLALDVFPELARRFSILERRELIGVQRVREQIHPEHIVVREHPTPEDPSRPRAGEAQAFAWMGAMLACAALFGFVLGGPLFTLAYLRLHGRRGWPVALAVSVGLGVFIVAVFDWTFDAPLWRGQIWTWLGF